ncbi:MAG TPA: GNAT family protein [Armatimonadota bacterium]|nr:GNAT family protein [Armatimonadota bacterium]HPP73519.1 GNAT family protein [Armatimonadota bacterium]
MKDNKSAFLVGGNVYLRPVEKDDLPHMQRWVNDPEVRGLIGSTLPMDQQGIDEWFEKSRSDDSRVWFVICTKEDNQVIGECGLLRMFPAWRTTDLSIIMGEKNAQGKGYGTEAINLLLDYAFGYLNFHRVAIGVVGFNDSAIRFYEKIGFKKEGIQRDGYYYNHEYHDFVMMSILDDEFRVLNGGKNNGSG